MKDYLKDFEKGIKDLELIHEIQEEPKWWISSGVYALDLMITAQIGKFIPQGKIVSLSGLSGSGKSFLLANTAKWALNNGIGVFYIDTENAIDVPYLEAIGVDIHTENFIYKGIDTISDVVKLLSEFSKAIKGSEDKWFIIIDSLDMIMTDSADENFTNKGKSGGDQGQNAKQIKQLLKHCVHLVKKRNVAMACVKQPYLEQDAMKKLNSPLVFTPALQFAFTTILFLTRLILKDAKTKERNGLTIKVFSEKNRLTKPYQSIKLDVPYDEGLSPYACLDEIALEAGIISKKGAWTEINGRKTQKLTDEDYEWIVSELKNTQVIFDAKLSEDEVEDMEGISA